jgi:hypothetical protein
MRVKDFLSAMLSEYGARRKRLRAMFGDRGQSLAEFALVFGLSLGSLGLFVREWMARSAPWGFALPFVFLAGYVLIEARRQGAVKRGADADGVQTTHDWSAALWAMACALAGIAAFVIAWNSAPPPAPPPPPPEEWAPPESAVDSTIMVAPPEE